MNINVNFGGFYGSLHELNIESVIENEQDYYLTESEDKDKLKKYLEDNSLEFWELYDYKDIYIEYSKMWIELFKDWLLNEFDLNIPLEFLSLSIPKCYNYSTDVIIAKTKIKKHEIKSILHNDTLNRDFDLLDLFEDRVSDVTTSKSGYIAFYNYHNVINMINNDNKRVYFECLFDTLIDIFNYDFFPYMEINESLYSFISINTNKHKYND